MTPEEEARVKIDKQLRNAGWDIVSREEYVAANPLAVKEALHPGNKESDYLLFVDNKAIAVIEAKREENTLGNVVAEQAEFYAANPLEWYGLWTPNVIPLVYLANGSKIYFKNMLLPESKYIELPAFHSPKKMLQLIKQKSEYGALPRVDPNGLRQCQYDAIVALEKSLKEGKKRGLACLATGSGKTYLACLAAYRLLNYTPTKRVLFLVDRNNLARQAENEFSKFDRTEGGQALNALYQINRLRRNEDINGQVVISTIQKLFAVLTGKTLVEGNEDEEDEETESENEQMTEIVTLDGNLNLPPDYFQFIVVDECHRSIYGKWRSVLEYFKDAKILGLTATPTEEAYAFFNTNIVEKYTYNQSVLDGVNVAPQIYRIETEKSTHGGTIGAGTSYVEVTNRSGGTTTVTPGTAIEYTPSDIDRTVTNIDQIETILAAYRDAIYKELYPERKERWEYIPKTLIFAKTDRHATQIVEAVEKVFAEKFPENKVPDGFVQKITYSAGDSNALIRDFRAEKNFRIAVTVTLVATGTDVKPLEVVFFMRDINSEVLYTQMKGRGCRTISDDKLKEVTPNAAGKDRFYIVDAIGVTEHEKFIPKSNSCSAPPVSLELLLEQLAHGEVSDTNMILLRDQCSRIHNKYAEDNLFRRHLDAFIYDYGFSPKSLAEKINAVFDNGKLPPFVNISEPNTERKQLIACLMDNVDARKKLLEMKKGYSVIVDTDSDEVIYAGFSKESALSLVNSFESCIAENKDRIEALRIIYNEEHCTITHTMLRDLQEKLLNVNRQFLPQHLWKNYKILDEKGAVDELDFRKNANILTHLIQIVRYAWNKNATLSALNGTVFNQRFSLYCGQAQRTLSDEQIEILRKIAEYIVTDGGFTSDELNEIDTDLWRNAVKAFSPAGLVTQLQDLSLFLLKAT